MPGKRITSAILAVLDFAEGDKPISTAGVTPDSTFDDQTAKYARVAFWIRIPIWASFPKKMLEDGTKMPIWQERGLNRAFYFNITFPKLEAFSAKSHHA